MNPFSFVTDQSVNTPPTWWFIIGLIASELVFIVLLLWENTKTKDKRVHWLGLKLVALSLGYLGWLLLSVILAGIFSLIENFNSIIEPMIWVGFAILCLAAYLIFNWILSRLILNNNKNCKGGTKGKHG